MDQGAATTLVGNDDFDAMAREQANGGRIDGRINDRTYTTRQKGNAPFARTQGLEPPLAFAPRRQTLRSKPQHGGDRSQSKRGEQPGKRLAHPRRRKREPQAAVMGENLREQRSEKALDRRPTIGCLDVRACVIHEVHVMHARGTSGHAGKAGEAAIDVLDDVRRGVPAVLKHILDQVDAPARGIELVPQQHVSRTGRSTKAAMHAGAQDSLCFGNIGIRELGERKGSLHANAVIAMAPA